MFYWNTHNLQLWWKKALQATHRSTARCLQEHRNWNPHKYPESISVSIDRKIPARKHKYESNTLSIQSVAKNIHSLQFKTEKQKTIEKNRSLQRDVFPTCWWTVFWSPPIPKRWDRGSCWLWWLGHRGSSPQWSWFHFGSTNLAFSILGSLKALKKMSQLIRIYIKHSQIIIVDILIASISISINCLLRKLSPWKSTNLTVKRSPGHRCTCRFSLVPPGAEGRPCTSCFQCIVKGNKGGITASITGRVTTIHPGMYNDIHAKLTEQSYNDWRKWGFLSQLSLNWVSKPSIYKNFSEHIQCISVSQVQRKSQAFAQLMWRQFSLGCSK